MIACHCGVLYAVADTAVELARKYANFYAEITLTPVCAGIIDYLVEGCGPDRVLYGSDMPMRDPRQQLGWVVYSRLLLDQKQAVLGGNAQWIMFGSTRRTRHRRERHLAQQTPCRMRFSTQRTRF